MGRLKKELSIFGALFAALVTVTVIDSLYLATMGALVFLSGIPTPGGAPVYIHVLNFGVKGGWAALVYALIMRAFFGQVNARRVAALWASGLVVIAVLGSAAGAGALEVGQALLIGLGTYLLIGQFLARDWVSR